MAALTKLRLRTCACGCVCVCAPADFFFFKREGDILGEKTGRGGRSGWGAVKFKMNCEL